MKSFFAFCGAVLLGSGMLFAQEELPEFKLEKEVSEKHLRYLASDELMGRRTGAPGIDMAGAYIREQYKSYGIEPAPGTDDYYQYIDFANVAGPAEAKFVIGEEVFKQGDNLMILSGNAATLDAPLIFAGHGLIDEEKGYNDYKDLEVKGKVVVVLPGTAESTDPMVIFETMRTKMAIASEQGAVGLIELYRISFPWGFFTNYFGKPSLRLARADESGSFGNLTYGWLKEADLTVMNELRKGNVALTIKGSHSGSVSKKLRSQNVAGFIPGTDPSLKDEVIVLSAHYDHVGTGKDGGSYFTEEDSIFNGARDNAMGTVALLSAAKSLSQEPPKRSVLVLALTAEEVGLLGSQYYVNNPLIPLNKTVFNLNADGAGYNDKTMVGVIGYGRSGTDEEVTKGAATFGLTVSANPAPAQNLFDRSDNVSFAKNGIPALNMSPGFVEFDAEINKNYHQVTDEADTIDFDYLLKYCKAYAHTARLIANKSERPMWKEGDKYEEAGKSLYSSEGEK